MSTDSTANTDITMPAEIDQIIRDIETIKIQGATAVAEAAFRGISIYLRGYIEKEHVPLSHFLVDVERVGRKLANARPNEPLARNGLKYVMNMYRIRHPEVKDQKTAAEHLLRMMDEFLGILSDAKTNIAGVGVENFASSAGILTHCHSSTVERMCDGIQKKRGDKQFSVVAMETRPLYQGRITATNLLKLGIDVKMIVDSAVTSFMVGHWNIPVDVVFIGCDEITVGGDVINKVGSYSVALSAYYAGKPIYVVGPLLKFDPSTVYDPPEIEMRGAQEIWPDAPTNLKIINPAFELVPAELITGFVTEFGVLPPNQVEKELGKHYEWMW